MKKSLLIISAFLIVCSLASASISYPDVHGLTVDFINIQEDNQGLYGAPTVSGDTLYFNSTDFKVAASGAGGFDFLDGALQVTLDAHEGRDIDSIELEEFGDWYLNDLLGFGTTATQVQVVALAKLTIREVEGVPLTTPILLNGQAVYKPAGGVYDVINHGPDVYDFSEMLWEAEVNFDIDAALAAQGIEGKATQVHFSLDNKLFAFSEQGTVAQIAKKGAHIVSITVPEPATLALLGFGGLLFVRRKR